MTKIENFFNTDPDWLEAKKKASKITSDKTLTRLEFLRLVGKKRYSKEAYQQYLDSLKEKPEEEPPEFIFKDY